MDSLFKSTSTGGGALLHSGSLVHPYQHHPKDHVKIAQPRNDNALARQAGSKTQQSYQQYLNSFYNEADAAASKGLQRTRDLNKGLGGLQTAHGVKSQMTVHDRLQAFVPSDTQLSRQHQCSANGF